MTDLYHRAVRHHLAGEFGPAIKSYKRALKADPLHADALSNLGAAYLKHDPGDPAEAVHALQKAVRIAPRFSDAYINLGSCHRRRGALTEALAAFSVATGLVPLDAQAYERIGSSVYAAHAAAGSSEAVAHLPLAGRAMATACALDPTNAAVWEQRGEVALALGYESQALGLPARLCRALHRTHRVGAEFLSLFLILSPGGGRRGGVVPDAAQAGGLGGGGDGRRGARPQRLVVLGGGDPRV